MRMILIVFAFLGPSAFSYTQQELADFYLKAKVLYESASPVQVNELSQVNAIGGRCAERIDSSSNLGAMTYHQLLGGALATLTEGDADPIIGSSQLAQMFFSSDVDKFLKNSPLPNLVKPEAFAVKKIGAELGWDISSVSDEQGVSGTGEDAVTVYWTVHSRKYVSFRKKTVDSRVYWLARDYLKEDSRYSDGDWSSRINNKYCYFWHTP